MFKLFDKIYTQLMLKGYLFPPDMTMCSDRILEDNQRVQVNQRAS